MDKGVLKQFLKSGHLDQGVFHETESGVPQGGSISPVIANMTLDGLQAYLRAAAKDYV
jgi:RNA-directed DNA polymerase